MFNFLGDAAARNLGGQILVGASEANFVAFKTGNKFNHFLLFSKFTIQKIHFNVFC